MDKARELLIAYTRFLKHIHPDDILRISDIKLIDKFIDDSDDFDTWLSQHSPSPIEKKKDYLDASIDKID